MPGIMGLTLNASTILTDVEIRYKSIIDSSSMSAIITQGSVVYDLDEQAYVVLWPEKVQRASIEEDGTISIET